MTYSVMKMDFIFVRDLLLADHVTTYSVINVDFFFLSCNLTMW